MELAAYKLKLVQLAAYDTYEKALAKARKSCEDANLPTAAVDEYAVYLEHLKMLAGGGDVNRELTLAGTPMGELLSQEHFQDDDGTDLQADALDRWLQDTAGAYVPAPVIAAWPLDQRKLVAAWLRAVESNTKEAVDAQMTALGFATDMEAAGAILSDEEQASVDAIWNQEKRNARVTAPDFFDLGWFDRPTTLDELAWTEEEVITWLKRGPWGVQVYEVDGVSTSEWILLRMEGDVTEEGTQVYGSLDEARLAAAKTNYGIMIDSTVSTVYVSTARVEQQEDTPEEDLHPAAV